MFVSLMILFLGIIFVYLEFYLPGGLMGLIGGSILIFNIFYYYFNGGAFFGVLFLVIFTIMILSITIRFALKRIRSAAPEDSIYLAEDQEGFRASEFNKDLVGEKGEAESDLSPSGFVVVNGDRFQAVSKSGYIKKGSAVQVIGGSGAHLEVKIIK